jgi:hypothetical protein
LSIIAKADLNVHPHVHQSQNQSNSKVKTQKSEFGDTKRYENTVAHLNRVIAKEKAKIR